MISGNGNVAVAPGFCVLGPFLELPKWPKPYDLQRFLMIFNDFHGIFMGIGKIFPFRASAGELGKFLNNFFEQIF